MKTILALLLLPFTISIAQANNCGGERDVICPGTPAFKIDYHNSGAKVVGSNPATRQITIRYDDDGTFYTYATQEMTFGKGCTSGFCVGDKAVKIDYHNSSAKVVGVNEQTRNITVRYDDDGTFYTYSAQELTKVNTKVKLRAYKPEYHNSGAMVLGYNKQTQNVSIRYDDDGTIYTYNYNELTYSQGCTTGFCVGDTVINTSYQQSMAKVVGVNPDTRLIGIRYDDDGTFYAYSSEQLTLVGLCAEIGRSDARRTGRGQSPFHN
jgi:hypothetical protein